MDERQLLDKLRLIEALHAGAATEGERDAAAAARDRIRARLRQFQAEETPLEFTFTMPDTWSRRLLVALLRRYQIKPYRYRRQRRTTVMARIPRKFVDEVLWPEFEELNRTLRQFLSDVTDRVISGAIEADMSEAEERPGQAALPGPGTPAFGQET